MPELSGKGKKRGPEDALRQLPGGVLLKEAAIELLGNVQGLNRLQKRRLLNLYRRKVEADKVVSFDRARNMMEISRDISRQVGIIVNRRGVVEYVIVGDREHVRIPVLSSERVGRARFRGLRFIHTHLKGELLSKEDLTDLALLQLDLVACVLRAAGRAGRADPDRLFDTQQQERAGLGLHRSSPRE